MSDDCYVWCTACGVRLKKEEVSGWGCPKCGNQGVPCDPTQDVTVQVNWHELRILTIWAENWAHKIASGTDKDAERSPLIVAAIAGRLQHQWPDLTPLTLSGELAELPSKLQEAGIGTGTMESNVPKLPRVQAIGPGAVGFAKPIPSAPAS